MGQDFFANGDESLPYPTEFMYDDYGRTKCEAEKMVLKADQTVLENGTQQNLSSSLPYRSGTVNSQSLVLKALLRIKWKFELSNTL